MHSESAGLAASAVSFHYDSTPVLRDVSFNLKPGEMAALAGPNGSGKTTLVKLLSGVARPRSGAVTLDGIPVTQLGPRQIARRVAVVPQHVDPRLMFAVHSIVAMGRTPHTGMLRSLDAADRRAIENALHATDTLTLAGRRFGELSGGEQQRVMLAMALAQDADYLLLDEPTVHLDLLHQHQLLELLRSLHVTRNLGILAVMHDLNLAALYFDRLALMQKGRLIDDGPAADVLSGSDSLAIFQAPLSVVTHPQTGVPQVLLQRRD